MDLEQVAEWMSQVKPVRAETGLCTAARSSRSGCRACVDACPVGAVTLARGPSVADTCTACGLCAAACPTGAIRMEAPSDSDLLRAARQCSGDPLICACPAEAAGLEGRLRHAVLRVPCVGALSVELLAGLLATGHARVVLWRSERCGQCPQGPGSDRLAGAAVAAMNRLRPGSVDLGMPAPLEPPGQAAPRSPAMDDPLAARDRRAFLGGLVRGAGGLAEVLLGDWFKRSAPPAAKPSLHDVTGLGARRVMLRAALGALEIDEQALLPERSIQVNSACTLCTVCTRLCPSGALSRTEEGEHASLRWKAAACTDCGLCEAACPAGAVAAGEPIGVARYLSGADEVLVAGHSATCKCGQAYWQVPGGPSACMACRLRASQGR